MDLQGESGEEAGGWQEEFWILEPPPLSPGHSAGIVGHLHAPALPGDRREVWAVPVELTFQKH